MPANPGRLSRRKYMENPHFVNVRGLRYVCAPGHDDVHPSGSRQAPTVLIDRLKSQLLLVDVQERLVPAMADSADLLRTCGILLRAATALRIPVLASEQYPPGLGPTIADLAAFVPEGRRLPKREFSCWGNPNLRAALVGAERPQVVVAGVEAHVCVLQTALDLIGNGFEVFVAVDAIASRRAASREIALQRLERAGAAPVTVEMVLFEWLESAAAPEFRDLSRLIR